MNPFTIQFISNTDFQLRQCVEHIKLGQRDTRDAADLNRLAHHYGIKPSTAAAAAGYRAEFMSPFTESFAHLIQKFGWKRS